MTSPRFGKRKYEEYLRSEHWREVKRRYFASRLPKVCAVCGSEQIELHHKHYRNIGREELNDLLPLCRKHHQGAHDPTPWGTTTRGKVTVYRMLEDGTKGEIVRVELARKYNAKDKGKSSKPRTKLTIPLTDRGGLDWEAVSRLPNGRRTKVLKAYARGNYLGYPEKH